MAHQEAPGEVKEAAGEAPAVEPGWTFDLAGAAGSGIAESLDFARRRITFYKSKFDEAARRGDQKAVDSWGSKLDSALSQLRQLEKEAPKILIDSGRAWDAEEAEMAFRSVISAIKKGFRMLPHRIDSRLAGVADKSERFRIWETAVDNLLRLLMTSRYTAEALTDEALDKVTA